MNNKFFKAVIRGFLSVVLIGNLLALPAQTVLAKPTLGPNNPYVVSVIVNKNRIFVPPPNDWTVTSPNVFTLTVDYDPSTPLTIDYTAESDISEFDLSDQPALKLDDLVTLTDGIRTASLTVSDQKVTSVDVIARTVTGTSSSTQQIQVIATCLETDYKRFVTPAGGNWTADFSAIDLNYNCQIKSYQYDTEGNSSMYLWPYRDTSQGDPAIQ